MSATMYVDSHCHLNGPRFTDDRADAIARAKAAGLVAILSIGNGDGPYTLTDDYQQKAMEVAHAQAAVSGARLAALLNAALARP